MEIPFWEPRPSQKLQHRSQQPQAISISNHNEIQGMGYVEHHCGAADQKNFDLKKEVDVSNLHCGFATQQRHLQVPAVDVEVCETEKEQMLRASTKLTKYFMSPVDSVCYQIKEEYQVSGYDEHTTHKEAQDKMIAAHIWKDSPQGKGFDEFRLQACDVNSANKLIISYKSN
eukprot:scaffold19245_cov199-Amphora_coffeaeformis.AAC.1